MDSVTRVSVDKKQSGSSAIEFAFVLPLLLALTYATVTYAYVFVVYESINYAAQLGAESAVAVDPALGPNDYQAAVILQVQRTVGGALSWLPSKQLASSVGDLSGSAVMPIFCLPGGSGPSPYCPAGAVGGTSVVVPITFPLTSLFAVLKLPGLGSVPPLPASLVGVGVATISGQTS